MRLYITFLILLCLSCQAQLSDFEGTLKEAIGKHQAGDIDGAIVLYRRYLTSRPGSFLVLSNLGAAYARVGRFEDAIAQYRIALKLTPANPSIELNLALAYYKTGQTERAAAGLLKLHVAKPDELQPTLLLADCWLAMGRNKEVASLLRPWSSKEPVDLAISYMLGTALVRDNRVAEGQLWVDRILRNGDSAEARLLLGTAKLSAQEYPAALVDLTKAVELNPTLPDAQTYLGQALLGTGDSENAAIAFRKAIASNPNDFSANVQLAMLAKQDDNFELAQTHLQKALLVRPGDLGARYVAATVDLQQGDRLPAKVDAARIALESIVRQAPSFTEAHVTLATVYYRLQRKLDGDRERAIAQRLTAAAQQKQQQGLNVK